MPASPEQPISPFHNPNPINNFAEAIPYHLTETGFRHFFVSGVNSGNILPVILPADSDTNPFQENRRVVLTAPEDDRLHGLWKYVKRFNPNANPKEIKYSIRNLLISAGMDPSLPIPKGLNHLGSIGYFPINITADGKLILEQVYYLPHQLHQEIMQASSWRLVSQQAREGISRIHLYSVGLSVGSELVDVASRLGVANFTLGDPSKNHADAGERLTYYRPEYRGWGKTPTAVWEILRRNPKAKITAFYDGLTKDNAQLFFSSVKEPNEIPLCAEEVDTFDGKVTSRRQPRLILHGKGIHTTMIGDVGPSDIIFTHDQPESPPFGGRVAAADSQRDVYGANLVNESGNMAALFATLEGLNHIPDTSPLLALINSGTIGRDINTVPQPRGAILLAGAAFYEVILAVAEGRGSKLQEIIGFNIRDLITRS